MSRWVGLPWLGATIVLATLPVCTAGPGREDVALQRLETALCEKALECGCSDEPLVCGEWPPLGLIDQSTRTFDPSCVERWTTWLDTQSCQSPVLPRYADLCPLYHGTLREGEPCRWDGFTDTECERGLYCITDACRDPRRIAFGGSGQPCDIGERCDDGNVCFRERCERPPSAGEPCLEYICDADARCEDERCVALPGPGQACTNACRSGAFCRFDPTTGFGECLTIRNVGEPCQGHRECASGNCPAGSCEYPAELGDLCSNRLPCGPDQFCAEGQCAAIGSACNLLSAL